VSGWVHHQLARPEPHVVDHARELARRERAVGDRSAPGRDLLGEIVLQAIETERLAFDRPRPSCPTMIERRVFLLALAGLAPAWKAHAHHGFGGRYDRSRPIWLSGTVTRIGAAPPHPTIELRVEPGAVPELPREAIAEFSGPVVTRAEDAGATRTIEFPPVRTFFDLGGQVRAGDRVAILALRNCSPPHQLRSQWIRLASGVIVRRAGRMSGQVDGCG
jgi:hypothetical protein